MSFFTISIPTEAYRILIPLTRCPICHMVYELNAQCQKCPLRCCYSCARKTKKKCFDKKHSFLRIIPNDTI